MTSVIRERGSWENPRAVWQSTRTEVIEAFGRHFNRIPEESDLASLAIPQPAHPFIPQLNG
jgi:hypothetical protein